MAKEMHGLWVGPMPIQEFLDEFLPLREDTPASPQLPSHFDAMPIVTKEALMYPPFINLVHADGTRTSLVPSFKIINTSDHPDSRSNDNKKVRPDLVLYPEDLDISSNRTQFDKAELLFELKVDTSSEPFQDPRPDANIEERQKWEFEPPATKRVDCRGQLATYATEMSTRQFRRCMFTVFIGEPWVRFIRFDRSGAVVTERFNYRKNSQPLVDFLWRFSHLSDTQRGIDTTVRLATPAEEKLAKQHLSQWAPGKPRPVIVLTVPTPGEDGREFIAWGSLADAESLTGRATRGWPVYEKATEQLMFLKDTWRSVLCGMQKETETLQILKDNGVRNVPHLVCGDDIPGQMTQTDRFAAMEWVCGILKITPRAHNRFTTDVIGMPLRKFASSLQMMSVIYDAYVAHQDAYEKCKILHRDISGGNVLITATGGILNDWDLARNIEEISLGPRQYERTGTWQFMSTLLVEGEKKTHHVQDDIESFVLLVLYHGLRYIPHNRISILPKIMDKVFDDHTEYNGIVTGGEGKRGVIHHRSHIGKDFAFIDNVWLSQWLEFALESIRLWHNHVAPLHSQKPANMYSSDTAAEADPPQTPATALVLYSHFRLGLAWQKLLRDLEAAQLGDESITDLLPKSYPRSSGSQTSTSSKRSLDDYDSEYMPAMKKKRTSRNTVSSSLRMSTTASPEP